MTAPLDLLLKYLTKVGKVKVYQDETGSRIEWKLKPFAFFWAKTYNGGISLNVKRLSFENYVLISTGIGYCRVTVVARLYFKDVEFPEEFLLNECKIYFNSKKLITIYFSDVQYQRCCDSPPKNNSHDSDEEEEEDEEEIERVQEEADEICNKVSYENCPSEICGDICEIYEEEQEMEDLEEDMEDLYEEEE
jgi:hypothetical protein